MKKDFSKLSLHSKLFKGRADWYFFYLKSEKIAGALLLLAGRAAPGSQEALKDTADDAARIIEDVVYVAAGDLPEEALLASLFSILSKLRLNVGERHISKETVQILIEEYEGIIERVVGDSRHLGLSLSPQDLAVPATVEEPLFAPLPSLAGVTDIKDMYKGHLVHKTQKDTNSANGQQRMGLILDFVKTNNEVSIKDIAAVVRDCSEKTIQRDLNTMIERGLVVRQGERRWSTYRAT
ncbi:MAG: DeoR family transcriptional regulator [Patescibacteria group bacterium]|nr:DeoR family transcriptional regulator [Patescibacteria group bacterium]